MLNKEEKINFLNNEILNYNIHILNLEANINEYPDDDIIDKPTRQSVLNDIYNKKAAIEEELASVQAG